MGQSNKNNPGVLQLLDLHVIFIQCISLVSALILANQFGRIGDIVLLTLVVLLPQGRIYTQVQAYLYDGKRAALPKFIAFHEGVVLVAASVTLVRMWPL